MDVNESKSDSDLKISTLVHELAQSLLIIQSYIRGSMERIKNNNLNKEQLSPLFVKINEQMELMLRLIQGLIDLESTK